MSKYKVGDRVVVISEEEADKKQDVDPGFVNDMKQYCGKTVTIKDVKKLGCGSTKYYIEEAEWAWCDEFFEGLEKDGDTFDLDEGIRICLLKYLLGGHKEYMAIMDAARKAYKKTIKEDQKKAAEKHEKALAPVREATKKMEEKEKRDKEIEELIAKAIKKALAETGEKENKSVEE